MMAISCLDKQMHRVERNGSLKSLTTMLFFLLLLIQQCHCRHLTTNNYQNNDVDTDNDDGNSSNNGAKSSTSLKFKEYLQHFGYLPVEKKGMEALLSEDALSAALKDFQRFANVPLTGKLDADTRKMMAKKRCGVPDIRTGVSDKPQNFLSNHPNTPLAQTQYTKWQHNLISYRLYNFTPDLDNELTREVIRRAFHLWFSNIDSRFVEKESGDADIKITFFNGTHGDECSFVVEGGEDQVAHAFPPGEGIGGDIHLNDGELWTDNSSQGVNFFQTVLHELGHSLGLVHLENNQSIMSPWTREYMPDYRLSYEDILIIQYFYGARWQNPENEDSNNRELALRKKCGLKVDAVSIIGSTYFFFEGKRFYRFTKEGNLTRESVELDKFRKVMPESLEKIDAIFENKPHVYFFSGNFYWKYNGSSLDGFPRGGRPITDFNLSASLEKIDAAFKWYDQRVYLISGDKFWRLSENDDRVDKDYPKDMSVWGGVKLPVDAAFTDKNVTYFFNGPNFWTFNSGRMRVRSEHPKVTADHWFKCPMQSLEKQKEQSISDAPPGHQLPFVVSSLAAFVAVWMSGWMSAFAF